MSRFGQLVDTFLGLFDGSSSNGYPMGTSVVSAPYRGSYGKADIARRFFQRMNAELEANNHKPDWRGMSQREALSELRHHHKKLAKAVKAGDQAAIKEYAADVANCSMFVAWSSGLLQEEDNSPGNRGVDYGGY